MYGIPEFRLPKEIVQSEVDYIKSLGAELKLDSVVGKIDTVDELLDNGYDAVFIRNRGRASNVLEFTWREPLRHLFC